MGRGDSPPCTKPLARKFFFYLFFYTKKQKQTKHSGWPNRTWQERVDDAYVQQKNHLKIIKEEQTKNFTLGRCPQQMTRGHLDLLIEKFPNEKLSFLAFLTSYSSGKKHKTDFYLAAKLKPHAQISGGRRPHWLAKEEFVNLN